MMVSIPIQHSVAGASLHHHQHHQPNGYYPAMAAAVADSTTASATASQPPATPLHASLYDVCYALNQKIDAFLAEEVEDQRLRDVQSRLRVSLDLVEQALKKYRLSQIAISWNGGKDCLVMLVILLASIARCYSRSDAASGALPDKLRAVYIVSAHPFPEVDTFVEASSFEYHLDTERYMLSMKEGLGAFLKENPNIEAVFVGTRRTDPHGDKLKPFDPTDSGWPAMMRLHSILDWRLAEIWTFIRHLEIPYLSLYDQGYTSLGGIHNTRPNPRLKNGENSFLPAYELTDDDDERLGRCP